VNGRSQNDPAIRMVKEKLGLQTPLSQDPSLVAETTALKDRLSAVAKQASDHGFETSICDFSRTWTGPNG
jgi:hypothetical protein